MRPVGHEDISKPLVNSFIHTGKQIIIQFLFVFIFLNETLFILKIILVLYFIGHGGATGKRWGDVRFIDDMYLKNPAFPPDVTERSDMSKKSSTFIFFHY